MISGPVHRRLQQHASRDRTARDLLTLAEEVYDECVQVTKAAIRHLPEYTLHDREHIDGVLDRMGRLIPAKVLTRLQPLELCSLMMSAGLHDIGMAPSEDEARRLRLAAEGNTDGEEEVQYVAFREAYPQLLRRQAHLRSQGRHTEADEIEGFLLSDFLREHHAERARRYIRDHLESKLAYGNLNFSKELADVCFSHSEEPSSLESIPCWELVGRAGKRCNWRFVAVVLRLADILDFDPKRTPRVLFEHLGVRSDISVREWKKNLAVTGWDIRPGNIAFAARCPDPVIEKTLRDFMAMIDGELMSARAVLSGMHHRAVPGLASSYDLKLPTRVDASEVGPVQTTEGPLYEFADVAFHLDQESIRSLFMGLRLYTDRKLFLRELIQNAVDASRHRKALHERRPDLGPYAPSVTVRLLEENGRELIEVEDNGMGMDEDIVRNHFACLGASYYSSRRFREERARAGLDFRPVAQFGIGVLSSFMAGDLLEVDTLRFGQTARPISVEIAGEGALFWFREGTRQAPGTRIRIRLTIPSEELLNGGAQRPGDVSLRTGAPLEDTVSALAPHVGLPMSIEERGTAVRLTEGWSIPPQLHVPPQWPLRRVKVDLSHTGPQGIDGVAEVVLVEHKGRLLHSVTVGVSDRRGENTRQESAVDSHPFVRGVVERRGLTSSSVSPELLEAVEGELEDLEYSDPTRAMHLRTDMDALFDGWHTFWHSLGHHNPSVSRTLGLNWFTGHDFVTRGRWSQQGLAVSDEGNRLGPPWAGFPFPADYDVDLSGELVLPLSVDRKNVVHTDEVGQTIRRISYALALALLRTLGKEKVRENRGFFEEAASGVGTDSFGEALRDFLGD